MKALAQVAVLLCLIPVSSLHAQGALEPDNPPGPTMKTLQQVEPRTPISAAQTISTSGSYYLTNDITGPITIAGDNVDLDLNGFTLSEGEPNGITIQGRTNVRIHNGSVLNPVSAGVAGGGVSDVHLDQLRISGGGNCVNFFNPQGLVKISQVTCKSTTLAGLQVVSNNDGPVIAVIHDNVVSFTSSQTEPPSAGIRVVHGGTGGVYADVRNNRVFASGVTCIGVVGGEGGTAGTVIDNTTNFCDANGLLVVGDFIVTKNISGGNEGVDFNLGSAPNAAPVTAINDNPAPWHNIAEEVPLPPVL